MKKKILIILGVIVCLTTACTSNTDDHNKVSGYAEPQVQANEEEKLLEENDDMFSVLKELVDENYYCITELFCYGNLSYDLNSVNNEKAIVTSERFKSISDLKEYLLQIYIEQEVERLLNQYSDGEPFYFEQDGKLYINVNRVVGAGLGRPWNSYDIVILNQSEKSCSFAVKVTYEEDELYVGDSEERYLFEAVYEEKWLLKEIVNKPTYK